MFSSDAGTVTVKIHSKKLSVESSSKLDLAFEAGLANSKTKEIRTLLLMSIVLIAIEVDVERKKKQKERVKKKK